MLTIVFQLLYDARRALYVVETTFSSKFELTLSVNLFKIKELPGLLSPLSGTCFVLGMSDMQFCKTRCEPLRLKPTD
jgi:hypothetical protein